MADERKRKPTRPRWVDKLLQQLAKPPWTQDFLNELQAPPSWAIELSRQLSALPSTVDDIVRTPFRSLPSVVESIIKPPFAQMEEISTNLKDLVSVFGAIGIKQDTLIPQLNQLVTEQGNMSRQISSLIIDMLRVAGDEGGIVSRGSGTTVRDETKNWESDIWQDALIFIASGGNLYIRRVSSNTHDTLTFTTLPTGVIPQRGDRWILKQIVLAAGTAVIGKVRLVTTTGDEITNDTKDAVKTDERVTKTIETELQAIAALAADVQAISSVLDLSGQEKQLTILIDHAKDHASASVGQGTEYVVQVSQKASGNDTWRTLAAFTAAITVPVAMISDAEEAAGQTVIECGVATPVVGDILFFKNATIGSSEWANVIARSDGVSVTLESGLTNVQAAGTYYTQGEHFVVTIDVKAITRLRVVANNTKGTTNRAIVWRVAAITVE